MLSLGRLESLRELAFVLLRVVAGLMFAFHGVQKTFGILTDHAPQLGTQLWFGGLVEIVTGPLIAAGLFARSAAFVASGMMAVAYTQFHWKLRLDSNFFPAINKGELAALYAFLFLYVSCHGPGRYSLEARLRRAA